MLTSGLPSEEKMRQHLEQFEAEKREANIPLKRYQVLESEFQRDYIDSLVKEADIEPIPDVIIQLHHQAVNVIFSDFLTFRNNVYKIVGENEFKIYSPDE